jgi:hypothetical protein
MLTLPRAPLCAIYLCVVTSIVPAVYARRLPASDTVRAASMPEVLRYVGFEIRRPRDQHWYLEKGEQIPTEAALRRDLRGARTVPQVHVRIGELPHRPRSHADFAQMARHDKIAATAHRKVLSYFQKPVMIGRRMAIEFELRLEVVRGRPGERTPPVTRVSGYVINHASRGDIAVSASFWETGPRDRYDQRVRREARAILGSVALRPITPEQYPELGPLIY